MGKIKNDFQFWFGNNNRNVIRNGNVNCSISELGRMVEEYIIATADRLNKYQDKTGVLPLPEEPIVGIDNKPINTDGTYIDLDEVYGKGSANWTTEEFEEIKRLIGM